MMDVRRQQPHEPLDMPVSGGHRYTCALCGAVVSIPTALLVKWNRKGHLMREIQRELTLALLLKTGHFK